MRFSFVLWLNMRDEVLGSGYLKIISFLVHGLVPAVTRTLGSV